jgi:hypothetical protein
MFFWLPAVAAIGVLGVILKRLLRPRMGAKGQIDVSPVSTSWIVEHRADRRDQ